jgi:hypothetical protein
MRNAHRNLVGKTERKIPFWRPDIEGKLILKWILKKWDLESGQDSTGSG